MRRSMTGATGSSEAGHSGSRGSSNSLQCALFLCAVTAALACASPSVQTSTPAEGRQPTFEERGATETGLTERGKSYLEIVALYGCAEEYLPYPEGAGPAVPERSDAEWREREEELMTCIGSVADEYTRLATVRAMTFNGSEQSMSRQQMQAIARHGDEYLRAYAERILRGEREREAAETAVNVVGR